jgi:RsiW-degrading membrane proteinase PrsW (M82 family)/ribosomal protein S18 acetylase RimI-like enzyme
MLLLALAVAPGIAISLFIYSRTKYRRESLRYLLVAFLLGMVATLPALAVQLIAADVRVNPSRHSILSFAWYAFVIVALSEEGSKWLVLRFYAYPKKAFHKPFDGILFAVMIGMGFATVENIEYVRQFGWGTGLNRFFLSVPAHASFAVLMGYYMGWAKFEPGHSVTLMIKGLLIAVLLHGSFDFFLFIQQSREVTRYVSTGILSFGAFATFYIAIRLAMRSIRMNTQSSDTGIFIRPADLEDINTIGFLAQQIWPGTYSDILSPDQLRYMLTLFYSPVALRRQIVEDQHSFLIVEEEDAPVGFASWSTGDGPGVYKLHKLYVLPGRQGKGLGKAMLNFIFEDIAPSGARALRLNVNRNNKARRFYEKIGFSVIGEEDIDIGNNYFMNDYIMEMQLPGLL